MRSPSSVIPSRPAGTPSQSFAATVAEELPDGDDPEALPGAVPADERPLQTLPTIGYVGRYALKYQLGSGGLGTVHAALDPLLSRAIAVKTLHVDAAADRREALESQLLAEARAAAGLNHPHIVTVYDAGLSDEGVYIAMERLQGRDLRHLLADGWRPEPVQAARIARRLADALAYAHSRGVIHCDVKPANIYMVGRTQPKLLDFGIARVAQQQGVLEQSKREGEAASSTNPPELGSPYYVAPEQLAGQPLDLRCDVYGVGVVLYELLTGRRAFDGQSLDGIRKAVLASEVAPAHAVNPQVSAALSGIVARAMARNPAQRFRSARQLARALRGWLEEEGGQKAPAPLDLPSWPWAAFAGMGMLAGLALWWFAEQGQRPLPVQASPAIVVAPAPVTAVQAVQAEPLPPRPAAVLAPSSKPVKAAVAARDRPAAREPAAAAVAATAAAAPGVVQLAISPWGQVEIDGKVLGTTPPLSRLALPAGSHQVVIRNDDFAPFTATVTVAEDKPVTLRHRFGS